jgi:hypothetical protein
MTILKYMNNLLRFTPYVIEKRKKKTKFFYELLNNHREKISRPIAEHLGYTVKYGPFKGMRLHADVSWSSGDIIAKLLGVYEVEIHPAITAAIYDNPQCVVNIGSADGYYSIGLKQALPQSRVIAVDIDPRARDDISKTSILNNENVEFRQQFDFAKDSKELYEYDKILFIIDCEGCELALTNYPKELLSRTSFIIELHELFIRGLTAQIMEFLKLTHDLNIIEEIGRNPHDFVELDALGTFDKYLMTCEFRGGNMEWLYAVPLKGKDNA